MKPIRIASSVFFDVKKVFDNKDINYILFQDVGNDELIQINIKRKNNNDGQNIISIMMDDIVKICEDNNFDEELTIEKIISYCNAVKTCVEFK